LPLLQRNDFPLAICPFDSSPERGFGPPRRTTFTFVDITEGNFRFASELRSFRRLFPLCGPGDQKLGRKRVMESTEFLKGWARAKILWIELLDRDQFELRGISLSLLM